jgi:hypothetical protein
MTTIETEFKQHLRAIGACADYGDKQMIPFDPFPSTHWSSTPDPHFSSRHRITSRDAIDIIWQAERQGCWWRGKWWNIAGALARVWHVVLGVRG